MSTATPIALPKLNHYLTEIPEKNEASLKTLRTKAFAANTLAKIAYAAIVAICATLLVFSLFFGTPTGILPFIFLGLALSTPFLAMGAAKLQGRAHQFTQLASIEEGVAAQFKQIASWKAPQVVQFFIQHNLPLENLPMRELSQLNFEDPLTALLPLIARHRYFNEKAVESRERCRVNLQSASDFAELRIEAKKAAVQKRYYEANPALLDATIMLDNLAHPIFEYQLSDLGKIKDFQEMVFDLLLTNNDDYFIFHDQTRKPLTLREIEQNFNAIALRPKMCPPQTA